MATQPTELEYDEDAAQEDEQREQRDNPDLRQLRQKANRADKLEAENAQLKQNMAISEARLDLNDAQRKALLATHEGESTPDALRKTAETLGFAQPEPEVDPATRQAHEVLADARQDAQRVGDTSYEDEIANARNAQEIEQIARKHNRPWAT